MTDTGTIGLFIALANLVVSYRGFKNTAFFERHKFEVDAILIRKQYGRLLSAGFLHVSWMHLILNMVSLLAFSQLIEMSLGIVPFLVIYFVSLIGGHLFALFVHRNHGDYTAVGASGAVCGIIFASIALFPGLEIGKMLLPFSIPAWLYGILYVLYTILGIRSNRDHVGHEAHLGGAFIGMWTALLFCPVAILENYVVILLIAVPTVAYIWLILARPHTLIVNRPVLAEVNKNYTIDHRYNANRQMKQNEVDRILDKIGKHGVESLSKKEKETLDTFSRK